jgi:hypothetical protein
MQLTPAQHTEEATKTVPENPTVQPKVKPLPFPKFNKQQMQPPTNFKNYSNQNKAKPAICRRNSPSQ